MQPIYSISQLNHEVKELLDEVPGYAGLLVVGEISGYKLHTSGHHYFTLKDEQSAIPAVLFRHQAAGVRVRLQNGMRVVVQAQVTSFARTAQIQLYVSAVYPAGAGAFGVAFEQLKQQLDREGLLAQERKRPLPAFPTRIGLVTSPTGAAVRDMVQILGRRWPLASVVLVPALVQGAGAAQSLVNALALAGEIGACDLIICGRGGGSVEDLWAFNEEMVARAIAACPVPVISAVGHEPDVSIADFVADLRAPTPSGGAELAVPDREAVRDTVAVLRERAEHALRNRLDGYTARLDAAQARLDAHSPARPLTAKRHTLDWLTQRLHQAIQARLFHRAARLRDLQLRLGACAPLHAISTHRRTLDRYAERLALAQTRVVHAKRVRQQAACQALLHHMARLTEQHRQRLTQATATLHAISPLRVLARGYAVATDQNGCAITDACALHTGDAVTLRFARGTALCRVTQITPPSDISRPT